MFQFPVSSLSWIFLGIEVVSLAVTILWLMRPLRRCSKLPLPEPTEGIAVTETETEETAGGSETSETVVEETEAQAGSEAQDVVPDDGRPKVSVVVYSKTDEEVLAHCLEQIYAQEYPDFEVIVVCDGASSEAEYIEEKYKALYPQLYVTFIPPGSHNLSRRKLALTLGMKAAKGDVVVTTVSNIEIPSVLWLATLCSPLSDPSIVISLGYSHIKRGELHGPGRWYREFVSLMTDTQWIGYALGGSPYRGDGYNLAFRRQVFFAHKGYSQTIYLQAGDDDIFVNEIVEPDNFALAIDSHSMLSTVWGESANRVWSIRKEQYDFTSRWLPRGPFLRAGASSAMQWLAVLAYAGSVVTALPNIVPAIAGGVVLLLFWLAEIGAYRSAARRLNATRLWFAVPLFNLIRPVCNAWFKFVHRNAKIKNFTWQRRRQGKFRFKNKHKH